MTRKLTDAEIGIFDWWTVERREGRKIDRMELERRIATLPEGRRHEFREMLKTTAALQFLAMPWSKT